MIEYARSRGPSEMRLSYAGESHVSLRRHHDEDAFNATVTQAHAVGREA
jgi:hypothetical protein